VNKTPALLIAQEKVGALQFDIKSSCI